MLMGASLVRSAAAQSVEPEDDLELPATAEPPSTPQPSETPEEGPTAPVAPPPGPAPAASATAPVEAPAPSPSTVPRAVPVASSSAASSGAVVAAAPPALPSRGESSEIRATSASSSELNARDLERSAHSRPVARGFVLGGYVQADFTRSALSEDQIQQGGELLNQDRFLLRRGRIRLDRGWEYAAASLELDLNTVRGVRVGVRRAEGSVFYRGSNSADSPPLLMLTLGATDLPFGYELMESSRTRYFMERTLGSSALFPTEADVGVKISGAASFLRYALALTNGEPLTPDALPSDPNAAKDVTGRIGVQTHPSDSFTLSGGTSFAVGKGFHAGRQSTKDTVLWIDDDDNGTVSLGELVGVPGSAAAPSENFDRWALGLDLQLSFLTPLGTTRLYAEGFVAQNYDRGFAAVDPVALGSDVRHTGAYAAIVQDVTAWAVVGFRASWFDPNSDLLEDRRGELLPRDQTVTALSPLAGFVLRDQARLLLQYDFISDHLARDTRGVPADAKNDQFTVRLQVEL